jgi:translocation and assembly module TamB
MAGEIPLSAHAAGLYHGATDELDLSNLNVASRATQIHASGTLSTSSSVRFTVSTSDLGEWQPILTAFSGPQIPVSLKGRAAFNGVASGKLRDFALAGHLQMNNFLTTAPATAAMPARQLHWDSLAADIQGSPRALSARSGVLTRGPTTLRFDGNAYLRDGKFTDTSPFTLHLQSRNADFNELQSLLGYDYPVTGRVDLTLSASGTKADPHGDGQVVLTNGTLYGQAISRLTSDLRFSAGEAQLNNAIVLVRNGRVNGGGAFNPGNHSFRFNLNGTSFDLAQFAPLQKSGISVEGKMDFTAHGEGTLEAPVINADIDVFNLAFDHEHAGDFKFEAITHGADMQLTGRSDFEQAELSISGSVRLRDEWPANLSLRFDRLDVDSLLRTRLGYHLTSHVPVAGVLQLSGPLRQPQLLNATADLTSLSAELENFSIHNEGPVHFAINEHVLALKRLRLVGDGTDITAQGTVQLSGDHEVDVRSDGRLNLKLLESLGPGISASGLASVGVTVGGTFQNPSLLGKAEVTGVSISSIDLPNGLSEMNGTLAFNQDRLQIQKLSARVGGGTVNFSGFMTYSPHVSFDINASARDVRLRPAGLSATSDADLHLVGTTRESLLSGDVTILKLNLTPGFDFARYLEGIRQTATLPTGNSILNNVRMDIHVVTTPELQMEAASAKVSGDADLRLRGTLLRPLLLGRVDIMEGDVYFSGTKYRLERGEITFTGPTGIKPTLDLEATTRVRDYDITLGVNGTPDKLNVTYRSEPPLPSADIVALLALGHTDEQSALANSSSQSVSQQASSAILSQALNATLSSRSQRLFGISRIKVDPNGLNTETTPTRSAPAVTIEQQVSSNLTMTYSTEVSQTSQQVIQAEYNVSRNISIVAVRDQNGVLSFDVRLRQRRK